MPEGTITALHPQEHDQQRVNVFIDDAFALGVSLDTLVREELYVGRQIDAAQWTRLDAAERADKAYRAALRLIQARPRSTAELRDRLQRKQFAPEVVEQTLERLRRIDLLDDNAFARFWIENRNACRPRGKQALRSELHRKGIDRAVIDTVLDDADLVGDEQERALTLAQGVLPRYAGIADYATFQRRLGGYLQRRGFRYDIIKPVLEQLWAAHADDHAPHPDPDTIQDNL
jgi:regulatory protein